MNRADKIIDEVITDAEKFGGSYAYQVGALQSSVRALCAELEPSRNPRLLYDTISVDCVDYLVGHDRGEVCEAFVGNVDVWELLRSELRIKIEAQLEQLLEKQTAADRESTQADLKYFRESDSEWVAL